MAWVRDLRKLSGPLSVLFGLFYFIYARSFDARLFNLDDSALLLAPQVAAPITARKIETIFSVGSGPDYYPMRDLSYLIDQSIFGKEQRPFRDHQLLIFFELTFALLCILLVLGTPAWPAFAITAVWASHPVHAEMINWLSARKDLMAMNFAAYSTLLFVFGIKLASRWAFPAALALFVLALLSKSSIAGLPFVGLIALKLFPRTKNRRHAFQWLLFACALSVGASLFTSWFYSTVNDMTFPYSFQYRVQASAAAFGQMIGGWFFPAWNIVDDENWGKWLSFHSGFVTLGLLLWGAFVGGFVVAVKRKWKIAGLLFFGFMVFYIPISGLIFPHRNFYSVRYLEPGLFVFAISLGFCARYFPEAKQKAFQLRFFVASAAVFIVLLAFSSQETYRWSDQLRVFDKGLELFPESISLESLKFSELLTRAQSGDAMAKARAETVLSDLDSKCQLALGDDQLSCIRFWSAESKVIIQKEKVTEILSQMEATKERYDSLRGSAATIKYLEALKSGHVTDATVSEWRVKNRWQITPFLRTLKWFSDCYEMGSSVAKGEMRDYQEQSLMGQNDIDSFLISGLAAPYLAKAKDCL